MRIDPAIREDASALIDRLMDAHDEETALQLLASAPVADLPIVAAAALVILATQTTEVTDERKQP